jgi:hypothetical protein
VLLSIVSDRVRGQSVVIAFCKHLCGLRLSHGLVVGGSFVASALLAGELQTTLVGGPG